MNREISTCDPKFGNSVEVHEIKGQICAISGLDIINQSETIRKSVHLDIEKISCFDLC